MKPQAIVPLIPAPDEPAAECATHYLRMAASQLVSYCAAVRTSTSRDAEGHAVFTGQNGYAYVICDADGDPVQLTAAEMHTQLWLIGPDETTANAIAACFRRHFARVTGPRRSD
jgi:hypothetical protein